MTDNIIKDTDKKKEAKEKFAALVKVNIDEMFAKDLTEDEVDVAIMGEVGKIVEEATIANNINATIMEDSIQAAEGLQTAEKGVGDLKKIVELKDDLGMAA